MFIGDWMQRGELYHGDRIAVVDLAKGDAGRFSYRDMNARANRLAGFLRAELGVAKGDRVAVLALNCVEVLDAFFACSKIGAIFVPLNWRSVARELCDVVALTTPKVLLFGDDLRDPAAAIKAECPSIEGCIHLDGAGLPGSVPYTTIMARAAEPVSNEAIGAEDIACLLFTGGTTGLPKAAQLSHRMLAWNILNTVIGDLSKHDVTLTHTPMFHTGALFVHTLPLLALGGRVVIMRKWTADDMLELIEREKVTILFCVPTQFQMMAASPRFATTSFKSVRYLISGGAAIPVPLLHTYREQHGVVFRQGFGMTEFGPGIFSLAPEHVERRAGSIGLPNYFIEARIVDDDNQPVKQGEVGELVLKGPSACSGYYNNPEASRASVDAEGWFHTGDMARTDEDGFYYIADRKKDMFISGGENVYPLEIEKALYEHAAVAQCAVIGVPDEKWGEVGCAVIVLRPGAEATEAQLLEHCRGRLARYKVPRSVVFTEALPLSAAGKILKRELRLTATPPPRAEGARESKGS